MDDGEKIIRKLNGRNRIRTKEHSYDGRFKKREKTKQKITRYREPSMTKSVLASVSVYQSRMALCVQYGKPVFWGASSVQVTRGPYHGTWQAGSQTAPEANPSRGKVPALLVPTQRRNACCSSQR